MNSNKWKWIQAIGQAVVAAITALLTALTASACLLWHLPKAKMRK